MADAAIKIFNPWNLKNKDITTQDVESIMRRYGCPDFKVKKLHYFAQSCVHKSYVDRPEVWAEQEGGEHMVMAERPEGCLALKKADNEELEFAGDSVLSAIVGKYLKMRYPGQGEGFLTSLRTQIVNNNNLGELAKKMCATAAKICEFSEACLKPGLTPLWSTKAMKAPPTIWLVAS